MDTVSRFTGDEFAFIFSQIAKAETAAYIAQRLLDTISQPFIVQGRDIYVTATIGIAVFPIDGRDVKTLMKNADLALNQAKLRGKNCYQFYQAEMHELSRRELLLTSNLHSEAIFQNFKVYYQPRIDLGTKKIACMEAALQWQHPDFGLISFEEIARFAEKNNNIVAISEWLLKRACYDLLTWRDNGIHPQTISVPVSLKQLENPHFIQKVSIIFHETKLDPSDVIFEITESSLRTKMDIVEKMLHMLKHLGVQIAINHFGANHLQLLHLRRLPIDIFKIDRSLVFDLPANKESEAIVKMIMVLAENLQSRVIAEGVENIAQKNALIELGCTVMQGPLFSHPALANEFSTALENIPHSHLK